MSFFSVKISRVFKIFAVIGYFGWLGLCVWGGMLPYSEGSDWAPFWFALWTPIIIYLIYRLLNPLYKKFSALTFERKMMLIVVLAILLAVGMYAWSTIGRKLSIEPKSDVEKRLEKRLERLRLK